MPSSKSFASQVVNKCLNVTEKDNVTILVYPHSMKLGEEIAVECFKKGADALLNLYTDEYQKAYYDYLSAENLRRPSVFCRTLSENSTAEVFLGGAYDPGIFTQISPEKFEANNEGENAAHNPVTRERKVRTLGVSTSMVTRPRAKRYGFNFQAWNKMMNAAAGVDYSKLSEIGKKLRDQLSSVRAVRIVHPNGTDLSVGVEGRRWKVLDGVIDERDIQEENYSDSIPAGSIFSCPLESQTNGKITLNVKAQFAGKSIGKVSLEFKDGKVVSFTGDESSKKIREIYDKSEGDKDVIALLEIGFNPKAKVGFMANNIVSGVVTVGLGGNDAIGGSNKSSFFYSQSLSGANVSSDGNMIVKSGKLLVT